MSACVFMRPRDWQVAAQRVRKDFGNDPNVKVGVSTNFDKLCHCLHVDEVDTGLFLEKFKRDFGKVEGMVNVPDVRRLYESLDFFAISSYPSLTPDFQTYQLENAAREFDEEMKVFGIDIQELIASGKEFIFAEYGLGGGRSQNGDKIATNKQEAAKFPFFTIFNYTSATNPWDARNAEVVSYRKHFFEQTTKFLSGQAPGAHYRVSAVYNWNLGTYDFQGITNKLAYDAKITEMVQAHNRRVTGGKKNTAGDGEAGSAQPADDAQLTDGMANNQRPGDSYSDAAPRPDAKDETAAPDAKH